MYGRRRVGYKAIGYEIVIPDSQSQAGQLTLKDL
jgi:hypothetical protein